MPHVSLLAKMRRYDCCEKPNILFAAIYEYLRASVPIITVQSIPFEYHIEVLKGCSAAPILFNLCINELLDGLDGIPIENVTIPVLWAWMVP